MKELKGRWALITGATRGIGRSLALALARQGMAIVGVARTEKGLQSLEKEIRDLGVGFKSICLDLEKPQSAEHLFSRVGDVIQDIRVVCLNAATQGVGPFEQIPMEIQERMIFLNVVFPMKLIHLMIPVLPRNEHSFIVSMSSQAALFPLPWMATYSATKSFLHQMSLALSHEFQNSKIHFITAIPSHTETSAFESLGIPSDIKSKYPMGRPPDEIAELIVHSLRTRAPIAVTNVKRLLFLRAFAGLAPFSYIVRTTGRMFSLFSKKAYY